MKHAVELFLTQVANQVRITRPLNFGVEIASEESPDERETADEPRPFRHAIASAGEGKERMDTNGVGAVTPNDATTQGAHRRALQPVVDEFYGRITNGQPTVSPGVSFVNNVPPVNRL